MQRRGLGTFAQGVQNGQQGGYVPQQAPPPPQANRPQAPQTANGASGYAPTSYAPTSYDSPNVHGVPPEQFYGSLLDPYGRPSEVFCRLADAVFFAIDQQCQVGELRNTGVIEPIKYIWFCMKLGADQQAATPLLALLPSYYDMAGVPYRYVNDPKGGQMAIMDRRAWLHSVVFEARAAPEDSHRHWSRAISMFNLHDPATNLPFPTPFPRGALPLMADFQLSTAYTNWRTQAITKAAQMQVQANGRDI